MASNPGQGKNTKTEMSSFQRMVLSRVRDPRLKQWLRMYLDWPREVRAEAVGPVHSRIGAYASDERASVIMGQRESTILLGDVLSEGLVLLVSTAQGSIGKGPAALMGGTVVSLMESALRAQESLPPSQRARCLLVCDEFQTVTGADWEGLFAEIRKYGCSMMLATQSLARLDTSERKLKAGVLANVGVIIGYQMAAEDARIISAGNGRGKSAREVPHQPESPSLLRADKFGHRLLSGLFHADAPAPGPVSGVSRGGCRLSSMLPRHTPLTSPRPGSA